MRDVGPPIACPKGTSFEEIVRWYNNLLWRICLNRLKDEQAASDAVQETFFSAWRYIQAKGWPEAPLRPWLIRIAVNKCADEHKRRSRRGLSLEESLSEVSCEPVDRRPSIEEVMVLTDALMEVETALLALPAELRAALLLNSLHRKTYTEIACLTGVPMGTVKSRIHRARASLRGYLLNEPLTGATSFALGHLAPK